MSLNVTEKANIIAEYKQAENDTGSPEVQIALLTADINKLTGHFKLHSKDIHSRRGLIRKVNLRRPLLNYLKSTNFNGYRDLIKRLGLRG